MCFNNHARCWGCIGNTIDKTSVPTEVQFLFVCVEGGVKRKIDEQRYTIISGVDKCCPISFLNFLVFPILEVDLYLSSQRHRMVWYMVSRNIFSSRAKERPNKPLRKHIFTIKNKVLPLKYLYISKILKVYPIIKSKLDWTICLLLKSKYSLWLNEYMTQLPVTLMKYYYFENKVAKIIFCFIFYCGKKYVTEFAIFNLFKCTLLWH